MPVNKSIITNIPRQKLPFDEKDEQWKKDTVDAYIELSTFSRNTGDRYWKRKLYEYYNGEVHKEDYKNVLRPYGKPRNNIPADIKRYNIIKPVVDVMIGEKAHRPLNQTVTVTNPDAVTIKEKKKQQKVEQNMRQHFLAELEENDVPTGQNVNKKKLKTPEEVAKLFDNNYVDARAIIGQKALNYIEKYCEVYDKFQKAWFHFLVCGEVYSYRGVNSDEPDYTILNPLDVDYDKSPDLEFVEDGDYAIVRRMMHPSSVVDNYWEELTEKEVESLEDPTQDRESFLTYSLDLNETSDRWDEEDRLIEVMEVYWKSRKKIGFVTYFDEQGILQERMVEEGYEPNEGEEIEWHWVNEVWQGHRIDGRIYKRMKPMENQRGSIDNPSKCKLPINGRTYSNINAPNISLVSMGIPYQVIYDIYKYRLELTIAKSKDIIGQFDINAIPEGWDIDKFMYFVDATGIAWVNYQKEGKRLNPQHQSVMDMSIKTIEQYIALLESIRREWEQASGINRQRKGQTGQYEGKGVAEQSIMQSSYITEDYFRKFARFEERDLQALVDYSKEAWVNGKKATYVMPDGTQEFLDVDPITHQEAEYGVFVSNSRDDIENLEYLKQLGQSMIQNGTPASVIAEMLESNNFQDLKDKIKKAEKQRRQLEQQQNKMEQQTKRQELQVKQKEMQLEREKSIRESETQIEEALIEAENDLRIAEMEADVDIQQTEMKTGTEERKLDEEERHNQVQERLDEIDLRIEKARQEEKYEEKSD